MSAIRRISPEERRARLALRHHLAPKVQSRDLAGIARDQVGIHSSDPASVYLGLLARSPSMTVADLERDLYEDRALLRVLGMRRTMFVTPHGLAAVLRSAVTESIARAERQRTLQLIEQGGLTDDAEAWLAAAERDTLTALRARGEATATELTAVVPALHERIVVGEGRRWQGVVGMSTRVLFLLAAEWQIIRARPRGSWISSQYRWATLDTWISGGLAKIPALDARSELVRRWLSAYGPGTLDDLRWWTGWPLRDVRAALAGLDVTDVDLDGRPGIVLADDLDPVMPVGPWTALLPGLDSTLMGWADRSWFLGAHRPMLFDTNGNAGPTIWWDGRVVGGWGQRPNGEVVTRLLEDVGEEGARAIAEVHARLAAWLGPLRVTPRFRTSLEVELSAV